MKMDLHNGDCLEVLKSMDSNSVDSIVTDPPYGLSFMGKRWDYDVPSVDVWTECLRVLKPGGHLLAFAGTRTQHRMAVRIEDAGFEIRDMIAWVYGSGFPKSLDVSKAIDKAAGAERELKRIPYSKNVLAQGIGVERPWMKAAAECGYHELAGNVPATEAARQWQGWGTALKPALEPITVARKPLTGTVAENVLTHGTGALNVDGCRVATNDNLNGGTYSGTPSVRVEGGQAKNGIGKEFVQPSGRWPANLIHDGGEPATLLGEAARFFYCAKASKKDRNEGCEHMLLKVAGGMQGRADGTLGSVTYNNNHHPTVKPTDLMRYLCRLVTPPGGVVLDPFMGSGSTGKAAALEGFRFVGIERDAEYFKIATARISAAKNDASEVLL